MALWPFNRNKSEDISNVPEEIQEYYQAEHRERVGLAWLIAFLTLVVTVLVVTGVFFGGRWVYRKLANSDNKKEPTTAQNDQNKPAETQSNGPTNQPPPASNPSTAPAQDSPSAVNQPPQPSSTTVQPSETLLRTGPEGDD